MNHLPFYMAYSIEPVLLFDILLATFLIPNLANPLSTVKLIAMCTCQLQRCKDNLTAIHSNMLKSCFESIQQFEIQYKGTIQDFDFQPGALVLVQNSSIETNLGCKAKPCYIGSMVIVHHTQNRSYCLAELNRTILNLHFVAFCVVSYHACSCTSISVTCLVDESNLACIFADEVLEGTIKDSEEVQLRALKFSDPLAGVRPTFPLHAQTTTSPPHSAALVYLVCSHMSHLLHVHIYYSIFICLYCTCTTLSVSCCSSLMYLRLVLSCSKRTTSCSRKSLV